MNLEETYGLIRDQLHLVDRELKNDLLSANEIRTFNKYILNSSGKRLRPALVLFSARVGKDKQHDKVIPASIAVEMIHTATLIHDDVVDNSDLRRGQPTIRSKWGNGISIILGDYWFSKAFSILSLKAPEVIAPLMEVVNRMCVGELMQLKRCYDFTLTEPEYLEIVEEKTASLISSCCKIGALLGGAQVKEINSLSHYGLNLGIAFQITDDCLDLVGNKKRLGKSLGNDFTRGKLTLPLIYTLHAASKKEREQIKAAFRARKLNSSTLIQMKDMVKKYGGIEYALSKAAKYKETSKEKLEPLKETEVRDALSQVADYVVERVGMKSQLELVIDGAKDL